MKFFAGFAAGYLCVFALVCGGVLHQGLPSRESSYLDSMLSCEEDDFSVRTLDEFGSISVTRKEYQSPYFELPEFRNRSICFLPEDNGNLKFAAAYSLPTYVGERERVYICDEADAAGVDQFYVYNACALCI